MTATICAGTQTQRGIATFRPTSPRPIGPNAAPLPPTPQAVDVERAHRELAALVEAASDRDLRDVAAWEALAADAERAIGTLVAAGELPADLAVRRGEPAVVTRRSVAAAWARVVRSSAPRGR